jgi:hypothetical protein
VARSFTAGGAKPLAVAGHLAYCSLFVIVGAAASVRRLRKKLYP